MSKLSAVFKQIFGEALAPLGFVKIKSKYPYFVRVVEGGEIIHVITCKSDWTGLFDHKAFNVYCGIATVYRQKIDLTKSPQNNLNWLNPVCWIYTHSNPCGFDADFRQSILWFNYKKNDTEDMQRMLEHSLEITKQYVLPILNEATTIDSCLEYLNRFMIHANLYDDECFGNDNPNHLHNEGFLYLKTNNHDDIATRSIERYLAKKENFLKNKIEGYTQEKYDRDLRNLKASEEAWLRFKEKRDKFFNDLELNVKVFAELERRRAANTETLLSYGLKL